MENLKFRLKVRKFKCGDCDTISLIEFKQPLEGLYGCPVCMEPMEYMDDLTVVQEMEHGTDVKYRNRIKVIIDKLKDEAKAESKFSNALFSEGDEVNAQYRDGVAHGILEAVAEIEEII